MESRSPSKKLNVQVAEKEAVAPTKNATYNYGRRSLRSLIPAYIRYIGEVSGEVYVWPKAGSVVAVDTRDAPALLAKKLGGRLCCGTSDSNKIFEIV